MSQLLYKKRVPIEGEAVLTVSKCTLKKLLGEFESNQQFLLESPSKGSALIKNLNNMLDHDSVFLIGGFQLGEAKFPFQKEIMKRKNLQKISLYSEVKPAWTIASKLIHLLEDQLLQ